jgi:hypothetical protein
MRDEKLSSSRRRKIKQAQGFRQFLPRGVEKLLGQAIVAWTASSRAPAIRRNRPRPP